jgi:hypothetical protein
MVVVPAEVVMMAVMREGARRNGERGRSNADRQELVHRGIPLESGTCPYPEAAFESVKAS